MKLATQVFLTASCLAVLAFVARSQVGGEPLKRQCDPATTLSSPPEGACHYNCGGFCPGLLQAQNVQPGACVAGEVKCRSNGGTTLNLYWYDCVVNFSAGCTSPQVACKWQVDSGSGHTALVWDCENW